MPRGSWLAQLGENMTVKMTAALAGLALVMLGCALRAPGSQSQSQATSPKVAGRQAAAVKAPLVEPEAVEALRGTPLHTLLNPMAAVSDTAFQDRGDPSKWKPQDAFDLSGPVPAEEVVRSAIMSSVAYVLERQNENGGWDVELTGSLLSETADQAVDAVAITALCGLALRQHVKVDPVRVEAALTKATDFIVNRVIRGKLSTKVYYAVWRYSWGLKFLTGEYEISKNNERRDELKSCAKRMVQALLNMQLSNSKIPRLDRKRKAKMSSRMKATAMPANLGLILALPTDENFRGGASVTGVVPGSIAEKSGFKEGDKVLNCEGVKIENAFDYYMLETEWVGGQKIQITYSRPGEKTVTREISMPAVWPGYIGIKVGSGSGEGPTVDEFLKFSPSKQDLKLGDAIIEMNKAKIANVDDYRKAEALVMPGNKVKMTVMRSGKKKSVTIDATPAPEGTFGFSIVEEDKEDLGGVVLDEVPEESVAGAAGLLKGDRLMQIDHTPVLGLDHFIDYIGTLAGGKMVKVKFLREGAMQEAEVQLAPIALPGDLTFELDYNNNLQMYVWSVVKGGVADVAGIKKGWVITKVNGTATPTLREFLPLWWNAGFAAGDEVTFTFNTGMKEVDVKIELQKPVYKEEIVDVGGWNYYPMGVAASFCSAATLINLYRVQEVMGIKVPKESLASGASMLESIRHVDAANGNTECYLYSGDAKTPQAPPYIRDMRGCIGRITVCEMALVVSGKRSKNDLKKMIDLWLKNRHELDKVRDFWHTHFRPLYANAAYYWLFGHYHTCIAANYVGGPQKKKVQEVTLKALMLKRKADGTWSDHEAFGPLVGTAEALMILGEIDGPFRDGYPVATQPGKEPAPPEKTPEDTPNGEEGGASE